MSKSPQSLDVGNLYWSGEPISSTDVDEWNDFVQLWYDECAMDWEEICTENNPSTFYKQGVSTGNTHYLFGNYYDFFAAVAMNFSDFDTKYQDYSENASFVVDQSICPAGWTLPDTNYTDSLNNYYTNLFGPPLFITATGFMGSEASVGSTSVGYDAEYFSKRIDLLLKQYDYYYTYAETSLFGALNIDFDSEQSTFATMGGGRLTDGATLRCIAR